MLPYEEKKAIKCYQMGFFLKRKTNKQPNKKQNLRLEK